MFQIRYATNNDKVFWYTQDKHMRESEFDIKIIENRCYIISDDDKPVGVLRYNLFWDSIPFLSLIHIEEAYRSRGFGKMAMQYWENEMLKFKYKMVMTSTRSDERAQHFYRKLGYKDSGCLLMDISPFEQPLEIFLVKSL